jgi:hypothetical protein
MTDSGPASAALLTVLAKVFHPGRDYGDRFDYRSIASEVRSHPELLAALEFLEPQILTTGWRAGTLSDQSKDRIKQWLVSVEGQDLDGRRLQRDQLGRYRVVRRDPVPSSGDTPGIADQAASATLMAVLSKIFWPGCPGGDQFDQRRIAAEARNHPEMLAALEFLDVHKSTTGWRAGLLSNESMNRIKQWLDSVEGQELDGRRLEREPFGRFRVRLLRHDEPPPFC